MKKLLIAIIFTCAVVSQIFAQNLMTIKVLNVSVKIPAGWLAESIDSEMVFILYSPLEEKDTFQENVNLSIDKSTSAKNVKEYLEAGRELIKEVYSDFKLVEQGADYHVVTGIINGNKVKQLQYVVIKNKTAYVMTYTSDPENYSRYESIFKEIQKTFKVE